MAVSDRHQHPAVWRQEHRTGGADDLQRRAGNLYSGRVWSAARRRHAHPGRGLGVVYAAEPVARRSVRKNLASAGVPVNTGAWYTHRTGRIVDTFRSFFIAPQAIGTVGKWESCFWISTFPPHPVLQPGLFG